MCGSPVCSEKTIDESAGVWPALESPSIVVRASSVELASLNISMTSAAAMLGVVTPVTLLLNDFSEGA
jgi:hypothetical protein